MQLCCHICGVGQNGEREYYKPKPRTNADRIREMTDEELAKLFPLPDCPNGSLCLWEDGIGFCYDCWLKWLKKEVE